MRLCGAAAQQAEEGREQAERLRTQNGMLQKLARTLQAEVRVLKGRCALGNGKEEEATAESSGQETPGQAGTQQAAAPPQEQLEEQEESTVQ